MPPKLSVMPGLRMSTRAGNRDKHPGVIDLPSPRRNREVLEEEREQAAAKKQADIKARARALEEIAEIEDTQLREDERREHSRRTGKKFGAYIHLSFVFTHLQTNQMFPILFPAPARARKRRISLIVSYK